jgi:hypothetical protein
MLGKTNEAVLTLVLLALGLYFSVLLVRGLLGYRRFRRVQPTALATWPVPRPAHFGLLLLLGVVAALVALLNALLQRPAHHVVAQALMALYFIVMVPLAARIRLGFYRDGVWADAGFLAYKDIGRMAFRETPQIMLILLPRHGSGSFRLPVPPEEYGAARKILAEKVRAHALEVEPAILGL